MKKVITNYCMDTLLFALIASQVFTGILLHRFPPELTNTTILGLTRYTWGTLHWLASILFILVAIIHLVLHWSWVKAIALKYIKIRSKALMVITVFVLLFAVFMPYYVTRELPARRDFSAAYQKTTYEESERIKKELGGTSPEPHLISGPWRISPGTSEETQSDNISVLSSSSPQAGGN
jgi:hypothetical protein